MRLDRGARKFKGKVSAVFFSIFFNILYQRRAGGHCVKSVQIRSYFWSKYRKIRSRYNIVFGHFSRSGVLRYVFIYHKMFIVFLIQAHEQDCLKTKTQVKHYETSVKSKWFKSSFQDFRFQWSSYSFTLVCLPVRQLVCLSACLIVEIDGVRFFRRFVILRYLGKRGQ